MLYTGVVRGARRVAAALMGAVALPVVAMAALAAPMAAGAAAPADVPGGSLRAIGEDGVPVGDCPLKHTDVQADISGFIARVTVTQQFENPFGEPIEAVYAFPLSDRGAVDAMTMMVGDRVIHGKIEKRDVARQIYEAAKNAGQAAALLDQERPNIFTQSVANILPGDRIDITISYVEYLKYEAGEYEFSFPMVVGPRYMPAGLTDAAKIAPPVTPKGTRAGHDIALRVNLDAGVPVLGIASDLHKVRVDREGQHTAAIELTTAKEIPNRDFVLRYVVAGGEIEDAVLTHAGEKGKFFTLILQPPDQPDTDEITPKELIFVIDRSGSMSGFPIEKAKAAMRQAIEGMHANDTFNLLSFSGGLGMCFEKPVLNTPKNRKIALDYLNDLHGSGGTEMMRAITAALAGQDDPERLRVVCFMTDGFIGNDMAILDAIQKNVQTARVFSFGIGNGVNRFLLENMAREGRGTAEIVTLESDGEAAVKRFHERIRSPLLTDIALDFGELEVKGVDPAPRAVPDLFSAQPLIITGKYTAAGRGYVTVRGRTAAGPFERRVLVELPETQDEHDVLASLWARRRIDTLMAKDWMGQQTRGADPQLEAKIAKLGLDYGLMTQYTSFVAVEDRVINEDGVTRTVQVPVEMTDGVSYEGVFGDGNSRGRVAFHQASAAPQAPGLQAQGAGAGQVPLRRLSAVPEMPIQAGAELRTLGYLGDKVEADAPGTEPSDEAAAKESRHEKLDRSLWNLNAKLVNGAFDDGTVKVVAGEAEVFIELSDDSEANLAKLRALGVTVVSHARSSGKVYAKVAVSDLVKVAELEFVKAITPARF